MVPLPCGPTSINQLSMEEGPYYLNLKAAVSPSIPLSNWNAESQYVDMGTSQFWTVPFALYASNVAGFDLKMNLSDTARMLKPYLRSVDTLSLSDRIDAIKLSSEQLGVATTQNLADTSSSIRNELADSSKKLTTSIIDA